jgi:hypothetical protein
VKTFSKTLLLAALALAACSSPKPAPAITSFTADKPLAGAGDIVTLSWVVTNADQIVLDPGAQVVTGSSIQVQPTDTTSYKLTVSNADNPAPVSANVQVNFAHPAVRSFRVDKALINPGESATLAWTTVDVTSVSIDNGVGVQPAGATTVVVKPAVTTVYTLTATGPGNKQPTPVTVPVRVSLAPTITTFTADKPSVSAGDVVTLSWTGTGVNYGIDSGVGFLAAASTVAVRPIATTTYTLTAYGPTPAATAAKTVTVTVTGPAPGTRALAYTDPTVPADAALALLKDPASTGSTLILKLVAVNAISAGAVALNLPLDATRVALAASSGSDVSPGLELAVGGFDVGAAPAAAKAALATAGPLRNELTVGISQKPVSGLVPDKAFAAGAVLARIRLVPAPNAQPGAVFPRPADPLHPEPADADKPARALIRGQAASGSTIAIGTLALQ